MGDACGSRRRAAYRQAVPRPSDGTGSRARAGPACRPSGIGLGPWRPRRAGPPKAASLPLRSAPGIAEIIRGMRIARADIPVVRRRRAPGMDRGTTAGVTSPAGGADPRRPSIPERSARRRRIRTTGRRRRRRAGRSRESSGLGSTVAGRDDGRRERLLEPRIERMPGPVAYRPPRRGAGSIRCPASSAGPLPRDASNGPFVRTIDPSLGTALRQCSGRKAAPRGHRRPSASTHPGAAGHRSGPLAGSSDAPPLAGIVGPAVRRAAPGLRDPAATRGGYRRQRHRRYADGISRDYVAPGAADEKVRT